MTWTYKCQASEDVSNRASSQTPLHIVFWISLQVRSQGSGVGPRSSTLVLYMAWVEKLWSQVGTGYKQKADMQDPGPVPGCRMRTHSGLSSSLSPATQGRSGVVGATTRLSRPMAKALASTPQLWPPQSLAIGSDHEVLRKANLPATGKWSWASQICPLSSSASNIFITPSCFQPTYVVASLSFSNIIQSTSWKKGHPKPNWLRSTSWK